MKFPHPCTKTNFSTGLLLSYITGSWVGDIVGEYCLKIKIFREREEKEEREELGNGKTTREDKLDGCKNKTKTALVV